MGMAAALRENAAFVDPAGAYLDIKVSYLMKVIYNHLDGLRFAAEFEQLVGALRESERNELRGRLETRADGERELVLFGVRASPYDIGFLETGFGPAARRVPAPDGREYAEWERLATVTFREERPGR